MAICSPSHSILASPSQCPLPHQCRDGGLASQIATRSARDPSHRRQRLSAVQPARPLPRSSLHPPSLWSLTRLSESHPFPTPPCSTLAPRPFLPPHSRLPALRPLLTSIPACACVRVCACVRAVCVLRGCDALHVPFPVHTGAGGATRHSVPRSASLAASLALVLPLLTRQRDPCASVRDGRSARLSRPWPALPRR